MALTKALGGGGGSALTVKDEGSTLSSAVTSIDVVGDDLTATNVGGAVTLTGLRSIRTEWDPFIPDTSPHALTDEFTSNTVANYSTVNTGDVGVSFDFATTMRKGLYLVVPSIQYKWKCFLKALPAGDFTIHVAVRAAVLAPSGTVSLGGALLSSTNTTNSGSQMGALLGQADGVRAGVRVGWSNFGQTATGATFDNRLGPSAGVMFSRIRRVSTTYSWAFSTDPQQEVWTPEVTGAPAATPAYFGVGALNYGGNDNAFGFLYMRYYATGTQLKTGALRTVYG